MRRRILRHLRQLFRIEPGRPQLMVGVRAALAVTVPFAAASVLGFRDAGWTGLTGLLVTLADRGGSYHTRARVMGAVTGLGALVGALAALAGGPQWFSLVLIAAGVFVLSFARSYGETAGSIGGMLAVIFVASLGAPAVGWEGALSRGGALLIGGTWATLQALVLWPLRPYRPARRSVARVYARLASAASELAYLSRLGANPERWEAAVKRHAPVRHEIEAARATLAATRRGRPDLSPRGEHLLVLLESGELAVAVLFALSQAMEVASPHERLEPAREDVAKTCEAYAAVMRWVVDSLEEDPDFTIRSTARPSVATRRRGCVPPWVRSELAGTPPSVAELLTRLEQYARWNQETTVALLEGHAPVSRTEPRLETPSARSSLFEPIRENLDPHSIVLRHALRAGLVAALALACARALDLKEAHWVVLSAIGVLQPYSAITEERALQRGLGTLLGGTLAVGLATAVSSPLVLIVIIGALTAISVSLLPLNFGAFQVLLTPDFLLLATLHQGDWSVAGARAVGVVLACLLAVSAVWLIWPNPERRRFPDAAAVALRADGRYVRTVAQSKTGTERELLAARRDFGLALLEAEASFDRLIAEATGPTARLEPGMALLTYSRRVAASATALGEERRKHHTPDGVAIRVVLEAGGLLDAFADSLSRRHPPPPVPELPTCAPSGDPVSGELLERVPRQIGILHGAVTRISADVAPGEAWLRTRGLRTVRRFLGGAYRFGHRSQKQLERNPGEGREAARRP